MPRHPHHLTLAESGTFAGATVVCLAEDTAECRQWCTEPACQDADGCYGDPILAPWPDPLPVAQAPLAGHLFAPYGGCRGADWINAAGVEECHADEWGDPFDVDGDHQPGVRSGPIEITWNGDDYVWAYADTDQSVPVVPGPGQLALDGAVAERAAS